MCVGVSVWLGWSGIRVAGCSTMMHGPINIDWQSLGLFFITHFPPIILTLSLMTTFLIPHPQTVSNIFTYVPPQIKNLILSYIPLGRPRCGWVDNIRTDLQEVGCGYMDWIGLAQDRDRWRTLVSAVMNLWVPWNARNFLTSYKPVSFSRRTLHHGVSK